MEAKLAIGHSESTAHDELEMLSTPSVDWQSTLDAVLALGPWRGGFSSQNHEILTRRFGLVSGEVETLEAIGRDLGITRERVRQIQAKALRRIQRRIDSVESYGILTSLVREEVVRHSGALGKEDVLALLDVERQSLRYSPDMAIAFMLWVSPLLIELPKTASNRWIVYGSNDDAVQLLAITKRIHEHLRRTGPIERRRLEEQLTNNRIEVSAVSHALATDMATIEVEGYVWLVDSPRWHFVVASLRQIGSPTHFTDITQHVNKRLSAGDWTTERAVHGILSNHEPAVFRRVGPGTFGLAEWGLLAARDSVDLVYQILEAETAWLTPQQITMKARSVGWRAKSQSIIVALDLEDQRPNRRVRRVGSATSTKYGLSWWNDP
ncbi:MAG: hypothetical protein F4X57_12675 [Chloroflexi bacterium]|nr:hypothetical protein [Chloroflexota bacterium]